MVQLIVQAKGADRSHPCSHGGQGEEEEGGGAVFVYSGESSGDPRLCNSTGLNLVDNYTDLTLITLIY